MRCSKCGSEIPDHANFCRNCGSPTRNNMTWLVQRARANDQQALAEIYEISSPAVYKAIRVLIKDEDTVYDILQDTYVKAFTRLDQLQDAEKLIPWLKMIANNRAKDWLKKSKPVFFTDISGTEEEDNVSFEESIEDVRSDMNPEMSMDEKEVRRLVMEILDQLPEDQRIVIGMFYYEEMPVKDIAAALEVSENTVKSRLSYGRKKIKEQVLDLEKHGTKLYNVAPFVFFLYLLRRVDSVYAEPLDPDALQGILNSCSGGISGKQLTWGKPDPDSNLQNGQNVQGGTGAEGSAGNSWNRTDAYGDNGNSWSDTGISENRRNPQSSTDGYGDNRNNWGNTGASGNERKRWNGANTAGNDRKAAGAAAKAGTAKTAGGAAAKFAGIKIAALILAGSLGAGGITYGIVRNADTLPFVHEQKVKDTSDSAKGKTSSGSEKKSGTKTTTGTEKTTDTKNSADSNTASNADKTSNTKKSADSNGTQQNAQNPQTESAVTPEPTAIPEPTATPVPAENPSNYQDMPEYAKYASFIQNLCANTAGTTEIALYDIDGDGIRELIFSHGTCEADWINDVYTLENDTNVISIGSIGSHVGLYTAPDGNGIYSQFGHMGYEKIDRFTKNGNALNEENIATTDVGSGEYTTFDREIKLIPVSELGGSQQDQSGDSQETEGLDLIAGTWYSQGGVPYHYKKIISGNAIEEYGPEATEPSDEETISEVIKTDYGYFFRLENNGHGFNPAYRLELSNPETLIAVDTADPYSMDGYSGTDSLVRNKDFN